MNIFVPSIQSLHVPYDPTALDLSHFFSPVLINQRQGNTIYIEKHDQPTHEKFGRELEQLATV